MLYMFQCNSDWGLKASDSCGGFTQRLDISLIHEGVLFSFAHAQLHFIRQHSVCHLLTTRVCSEAPRFQKVFLHQFKRSCAL